MPSPRAAAALAVVGGRQPALQLGGAARRRDGDPLERSLHRRAGAAGGGRGGSRAGRCSSSICRTSTTSSAAGDKTPFAVRDFLQAVHGSWTPAPRVRAAGRRRLVRSAQLPGSGGLRLRPHQAHRHAADGDRVRRLVRRLERRRRRGHRDWTDLGAHGRRGRRRWWGRLWATAGPPTCRRAGSSSRTPTRRGLSFEEDSQASAASVAGLMPTSNFFLSQPSSTEAALLPLLDAGTVPGQLHGPRLGLGVGRPLLGQRRRRAHQRARSRSTSA